MFLFVLVFSCYRFSLFGFVFAVVLVRRGAGEGKHFFAFLFSVVLVFFILFLSPSLLLFLLSSFFSVVLVRRGAGRRSIFVSVFVFQFVFVILILLPFFLSLFFF